MSKKNTIGIPDGYIPKHICTGVYFIRIEVEWEEIADDHCLFSTQETRTVLAEDEWEAVSVAIDSLPETGVYIDDGHEVLVKMTRAIPVKVKWKCFTIIGKINDNNN